MVFLKGLVVEARAYHVIGLCWIFVYKLSTTTTSVCFVSWPVKHKNVINFHFRRSIYMWSYHIVTVVIYIGRHTATIMKCYKIDLLYDFDKI